MTTTTFFIIFIPILAILLLAINLILAPHNPYQEKDSAFECGFHSFLNQTRTPFNVAFFVFALVFLVFDIEVVMIFPYSVSGYTNDIYGLATMMMFFVLLTLGFVFELGKNALTIESRQTPNNSVNILNIYAYLFGSSLQSASLLSIYADDLLRYQGALPTSPQMRLAAGNDPGKVIQNGLDLVKKLDEKKQVVDNEIRKVYMYGGPDRADLPGIQQDVEIMYKKGRELIQESTQTALGYLNVDPNVFKLNYLPYICCSFVLELPLIEAIIASLVLMIDSSLAYLLIVLQPMLQMYRFYKLPSRLVKLYSLLTKVYYFFKNIGKVHGRSIIYVINTVSIKYWTYIKYLFNRPTKLSQVKFLRDKLGLNKEWHKYIREWI